MPVASESTPQAAAPPGTDHPRRLYRSDRQRAIAGVCAGLGEYFALDPVWFRVGFVILALGGGAGILIYLLLWLMMPLEPDGYTPQQMERRSIPGGAIVGIVFMVVGGIALINTVAPWMGQYLGPIVLVMIGAALLIGGLNHDPHR